MRRFKAATVMMLVLLGMAIVSLSACGNKEKSSVETTKERGSEEASITDEEGIEADESSDMEDNEVGDSGMASEASESEEQVGSEREAESGSSTEGFLSSIENLSKYPISADGTPILNLSDVMNGDKFIEKPLKFHLYGKEISLVEEELTFDYVVNLISELSDVYYRRTGRGSSRSDDGVLAADVERVKSWLLEDNDEYHVLQFYDPEFVTSREAAGVNWENYPLLEMMIKTDGKGSLTSFIMEGSSEEESETSTDIYIMFDGYNASLYFWTNFDNMWHGTSVELVRLQ